LIDCEAKEENNCKFNETQKESSYGKYKGQMNKEMKNKAMKQLKYK
jgi:hypothetical protein